MTAGGERLHGRALVGADGVNGVSAKTLGLGGNREIGVALEGNLPNAKADLERYCGRFVLELGTVPGGYGWVFRRVSISTSASAGRRARARTCATIWPACAPRTRSARTTSRTSAANGLRSARRTRRSRAAARSWRATRGGLIDPLTGDGMYEAFFAGRLASEAVLEPRRRGHASEPTGRG